MELLGRLGGSGKHYRLLPLLLGDMIYEIKPVTAMGSLCERGCAGGCPSQRPAVMNLL